MLLSNTVKLRWNPSIKKYYEEKGYIFTKWNDEFEVKVEDLSKGSSALVEVKCDCDTCITSITKFIRYQDYIKCVHEDNKYYCNRCSFLIYGIKKRNKTNNREFISFAQWGMDNIDKDFLEKYWDYQKNTVNPWEISYGSKQKIYIRCQKKDYHESYDIITKNFTLHKCRCPYCENKRIHKLDSLGALYQNILPIWSSKNDKSPYEYAPKSDQEVWWKCPDGNHDDYKRKISDSNTYGFRCPKCQYSKGEKRIEKYLKDNNVKYIPQKEFEGLTGLGNGNLSYDFYLSDYNLLIEFQGEFHDGNVGKNAQDGNKYKKQQEHDKIKRQYAKEHNINLLEIWYDDYDNIESILEKELIK